MNDIDGMRISVVTDVCQTEAATGNEIQLNGRDRKVLADCTTDHEINLGAIEGRFARYLDAAGSSTYLQFPSKSSRDKRMS